MREKDFIFGAEEYGKEVKIMSCKEIEELLEKRIMPKVKKLKDGRQSIALCDVLSSVDENITKENFEYIITCLDELDIVVRGKDSTVDKVDNYEYINTYRNLKEQKRKSLSKEENNALFKALSEATTEAKKTEIRQKIIVGNMALVPFYVYKLAYVNNIPREELESYGYEALINAVNYFDYTLGYAFSTYAHSWIYYKTFDAIITDYNFIPRYDVQFFFDMLNAHELLLEEGVEEDDIHPKQILEVIEQVRGKVFGAKRKEYFISKRLINFPILLSTEELDEYEANKEPLMEQVMHISLRDSLNEVIDTLTHREKSVIRMRFGLDDGKPKTLEEVAREFHVNRERIRQIEAQALRKLRHPYRAKKLIDFLD